MSSPEAPRSNDRGASPFVGAPQSHCEGTPAAPRAPKRESPPLSPERSHRGFDFGERYRRERLQLRREDGDPKLLERPAELPHRFLIASRAPLGEKRGPHRG